MILGGVDHEKKEIVSMKMYFGRPVSAYAREGSEMDSFLLPIISSAFQEYEILDPGTPDHEDGYRRWKEHTGSGMDYFFKEVLPQCDGGVFLPFRDGYWSAGAFKEASWFERNGLPTWSITCDGEISTVYPERVESSGLVLSVDQTRSRVYTADKKIIVY